MSVPAFALFTREHLSRRWTRRWANTRNWESQLVKCEWTEFWLDQKNIPWNVHARGVASIIFLLIFIPTWVTTTSIWCSNLLKEYNVREARATVSLTDLNTRRGDAIWAYGFPCIYIYIFFLLFKAYSFYYWRHMMSRLVTPQLQICSWLRFLNPAFGSGAGGWL